MTFTTLARRDILFSLLGLPLVGLADAAHAAATAPVRTLFIHHAVIGVSDMTRSVAFYEKLFGPSLRQGDSAFFPMAKRGYFALVPTKPDQKPGYQSFAIAVDNFDADKVARALKAAGATAEVIQKQLWVTGPSGFKIQLVAANEGPKFPADMLKAASQAPFPLQNFSHVSTIERNGLKMKEFLETMLGSSVQAMQGPTPVMRIGAGPDFIAFGAGPENPKGTGAVHHAAFAIQGFDANWVMGKLADLGVMPVESNSVGTSDKPLTEYMRLRQVANNGGGRTHPLGTYEHYFTDPDNILLQFADVAYCGGSGRLGDICP